MRFTAEGAESTEGCRWGNMAAVGEGRLSGEGRPPSLVLPLAEDG